MSILITFILYFGHLQAQDLDISTFNESDTKVEFAKQKNSNNSKKICDCSPADKLSDLAEQDIKNTPQKDRKFIRYISLGQMQKNQDKSTIEDYHQAINKLVNSSSTKPELKQAKKVDEKGLLLRIDLRDYGWENLSTTLDNALGAQSSPLKSNSYRSLQVETKSKIPFVRADKFILAASDTGFYHKAVKSPATLDNLRNTYAVNSNSNAEVCAGVSSSGVSHSNRIYCRRDGRHGGFWTSYDFAGDANSKKNIFKNPTAFDEDGGEHIYQLPNGLFAYLITDAEGKRINAAPANVVNDPSRFDATVANGKSCFSCHHNGLIERKDEIRDSTLATKDHFSKNNFDAIMKKYPPFDVLKNQLGKDNEKYRNALKQIGVLDPKDKINKVINNYESRLNIDRVSCELSITPKKLEELIKNEKSMEASQLLSKEGTISREQLTRVEKKFLSLPLETRDSYAREYLDVTNNACK